MCPVLFYRRYHQNLLARWYCYYPIYQMGTLRLKEGNRPEVTVSVQQRTDQPCLAANSMRELFIYVPLSLGCELLRTDFCHRCFLSAFLAQRSLEDIDIEMRWRQMRCVCSWGAGWGFVEFVGQGMCYLNEVCVRHG